MAQTSISTSNALSQQGWAKRLLQETISEAAIGRFRKNVIKEVVDLTRGSNMGRGDTITFGLATNLTGAGKTEGETLYGNEESLTTYTDSLTINELRHAVDVPTVNNIEQLRLNPNLYDEAYDALKRWYIDRFDTAFFNQLCGYVPQSDTKYTGLNAVTAPDSDHQLWAGTASNDQGLGSSDTFTLDLIDELLVQAETIETRIPGFMINGAEKYVLFLHPHQVKSLYAARSSSTNNFVDLNLARIQGGGNVNSNPLYMGALGEYRNVILHQATRVTQGVNSSTSAAISTVRRAVFCGKDALVMGFGGAGVGNGSTDMPMKWIEEEKDYQHRVGIAATGVFGLKKVRFNSKDYGSIVLSTYAA